MPDKNHSRSTAHEAADVPLARPASGQIRRNLTVTTGLSSLPTLDVKISSKIQVRPLQEGPNARKGHDLFIYRRPLDPTDPKDNFSNPDSLSLMGIDGAGIEHTPGDGRGIVPQLGRKFPNFNNQKPEDFELVAAVWNNANREVNLLYLYKPEVGEIQYVIHEYGGFMPLKASMAWGSHLSGRTRLSPALQSIFEALPDLFPGTPTQPVRIAEASNDKAGNLVVTTADFTAMVDIDGPTFAEPDPRGRQPCEELAAVLGFCLENLLDPSMSQRAALDAINTHVQHALIDAGWPTEVPPPAAALSIYSHSRGEIWSIGIGGSDVQVVHQVPGKVQLVAQAKTSAEPARTRYERVNSLKATILNEPVKITPGQEVTLCNADETTRVVIDTRPPTLLWRKEMGSLNPTIVGDMRRHVLRHFGVEADLADRDQSR